MQTECGKGTYLYNIKFGAGVHHTNALACTKRAVHHTDVNYDAQIGVVVGVEDQCLQGSVGIAIGSRNIPALAAIPCSPI